MPMFYSFGQGLTANYYLQYNGVTMGWKGCFPCSSFLISRNLLKNLWRDHTNFDFHSCNKAPITRNAVWEVAFPKILKSTYIKNTKKGISYVFRGPGRHGQETYRLSRDGLVNS